MKNQSRNSGAVSEIVSVILIIALIVVLATVMYALLFGSVDQKYLKKTVYIAGKSEMAGIQRPSGIPDYVLTFLPSAGDDFYLVGQGTGESGTPVSLRIIGPDGKNLQPKVVNLKSPLYGKTLFIYPNSTPSSTICDFDVSDKPPSQSLRPMTLGKWKVQLIDESIQVLAGTYEVDITKGTSSLPVAGGFISGSSGVLYRTDCTPMEQGVTGSPTTYTDGPGNMTYTRFNGASNISIQDDPTLSFTGDMTIALWMRPASTSSLSQIIGKGIQYSSTNENKNYDMYQISGGRLYFEWVDSATNTHYHIETQNSVLTTNNWAAVNLVIAGTPRQPSIYVNGAVQPIQYFQSNSPGSNPIAGPVTVNLKNNDNPLSIGAQNTNVPGNQFYYTGDIGALSLYNRGLSGQEIIDNYNGYLA